MPFLFANLCTLLSRYEDVELHDPPILLLAEKSAQLRHITESWFRSHRRALSAANTASSVAILSSLLPERRVDRVYDLQAPRLSRVLSRALRLGASRTAELHAYTQPGRGDLAICFERVLRAGGPPAIPPVTVEEIDGLLADLAACSRFSGPGVQRTPPTSSSEARAVLIERVLFRLTSEEGKWFVRLILKDFSPVRIHEELVLKEFHFLLPDLLRFQNDFDAAIALLKGQLRDYPDRPDPRSERLHRQSAARLLRPAVGVKVGRPNFIKARSIDQCLDTVGKKTWVLERKYDGEYCEVHIDLTVSPNPSQCIKIFSKSGKDSTRDRKGLHRTLVECLGLGHSRCAMKKQAILLGELVVYSDHTKEIMPFGEIRKHISRSGVSIGTDANSAPQPYEHLAIVFFDLLLLDDENVMAQPVEERRTRLRQVYKKIAGRAMGADWKIVDFDDQQNARKRLIEQFAASISQRCEGLILKPCGVPYFSIDDTEQRGSLVKLKKDYLEALADEADFAVVGASYNAQLALRSSTPGVKWTSFHLGCLTNKKEVLRFDSRPRFRIVGTITSDACIPKPVLQAANSLGLFTAKPFEPSTEPSNFDIDRTSRPKMDVCFDTPMVFEVIGSGYEKPSNAGFLMLRHARVKKLHEDRSWKDCCSFQELQALATTARARPAQSESQDTMQWIAKLERKCRRKIERSATTTPRSGVGSSIASGGSTGKHLLRSHSSADQVGSTSALVACNSRSAYASLDGTALGSQGVPASAKRPSEGSHGTPCPPSKRNCSDDRSQGNQRMEEERQRQESLSSGSNALADITNIALSSALLIRSPIGNNSHKRRVSSLHQTPQQPKSGVLFHGSGRKFFGSRTSNAFSTSTSLCRTSNNCLLMNATIYLSPCISSTPYITHDLLPTHHVSITRCLSHWDRENSDSQTLASTVSESQSYPNMRKIVLVESRRRASVITVVREILALNAGALNERIEIWDWRVLERCERHTVSAKEARAEFVGCTVVDESKGRPMWVSDWEGLCSADVAVASLM